jgi:hypothetical protein
LRRIAFPLAAWLIAAHRTALPSLPGKSLPVEAASGIIHYFGGEIQRPWTGPDPFVTDGTSALGVGFGHGDFGQCDAHGQSGNFDHFQRHVG